MSELPVIADTTRVTLNYAFGGTTLTAHNVMHFHNEGTIPELHDSIEASAMAVVGNLFAPCCNSWQLLSADYTPLDGASATNTLGFQNTSDFAGQGGSQAIIQCAALIKLATNKRGRSFRGRIYLPGVGESAQENGILVTGIDTDTTASWVEFLNLMVADERPLMVASYTLGSAEQVTNVVCEHAVATQRRRMNQVRNG